VYVYSFTTDGYQETQWDTSLNPTRRSFSVNYNGTEYAQCMVQMKNEGFSKWTASSLAQNPTVTYHCEYYWRVPVGYDGFILGLLDNSAEIVDGIKLHEIINENTLLFRFDKIADTESDSQASAAYEAYEKLLSKGVTENGLEINYYAYLDLGQDGVPELVVSNDDGTPNSWSNGEVYTYKNSQIQSCGSTNTRYDYFYYVNEQYLLGCHRMGNQFISVDGYLEYSSAEFDYFNTMPTENGSSKTFIKTAEPIKLLKNTFQQVTDIDILVKFFEAKEFYETYIYGRRFFDSNSYSAADFDWIEGVIDYDGGLYQPCGNYSYYNFIKELNSYFAPDVVSVLIKEAGIIEHQDGCYAYIREGVGDPYLGDYQATAELIEENLYELRISFTSLEGTTARATIYCRKINDTWVLDSSNFYGG